MKKMKSGELRRFFLSARTGTKSPDIGGRVFLVISARQTSADFLMDGVLYKGWSIKFLLSSSSVIDEAG